MRQVLITLQMNGVTLQYHLAIYKSESLQERKGINAGY